MNYKEYKQQLKEELEAYKAKIKAKLDEFKEKQNLKLEKFKLKTKNNKKKSKSKRKTKGGVLSMIEQEILESIILKLYYVILTLYNKPSTYNDIIVIIKTLYEYCILNDFEYTLLETNKISLDDIDHILIKHKKDNNIYHRSSILHVIKSITDNDINNIIINFLRKFKDIKEIELYKRNSYPTLNIENYLDELSKLETSPEIILMRNYLYDLKSLIEPHLNESEIIQKITEYNNTLSLPNRKKLSDILTGKKGDEISIKFKSLFADIINEYPLKYSEETSGIIYDNIFKKNNIIDVKISISDIDILTSIICKLYKTLYKYQLKNKSINCSACINEMSLNEAEIYTITNMNKDNILDILEGVYIKILKFDSKITIDDLRTCFLLLYSKTKSGQIKKDNNKLITINDLKNILSNPILLYYLEEYPVLLSVLCKLYIILYIYKLNSANKLPNYILFRDINLNDEEIQELKKITEISRDHPSNGIIKTLVDIIGIENTGSNAVEFSTEMTTDFNLLVIENKKINSKLQIKTAKLMTLDELNGYIDQILSVYSYTEEVKSGRITDEDRKNIDNLYKLYEPEFKKIKLTLDDIMMLYMLTYKIVKNADTTDTYYLYTFIEQKNEQILTIIFNSSFYNDYGQSLILTMIGMIKKKENLTPDLFKKINEYFDIYLKNKYQNTTLKPVIEPLGEVSGQGAAYGFDTSRFPP